MEGESKNGTCLYTRADANDTAEWKGVWDVPTTLKCRSNVESNALRDPTLPGFVLIDGDDGRQLGLSWGFVDGNRAPPYTNSCVSGRYGVVSCCL